MKINRIQNGAELTMALEGLLDTTTAPELDAALSGIDGVANLIIDMEKLDYISSSGLRVLLAARKKLEKVGCPMTIVKANENVREIFEMTGFNEILTIEK